MKYTCSFARERVFLLLVIFISVFLLGTQAFAQEENTQLKELEESSAHNSIVQYEPSLQWISESGEMLFRTEIVNNSEEYFDNLYIGLRVLTSGSKSPDLIDVKSDGHLILKAGADEIFSIVYNPPRWLSGTYKVELVLEDPLGNIVSTGHIKDVLFEGQALQIELNKDSCELQRYEEAIEITCSVKNNTDIEQSAQTQYVLYTPSFLGDTVSTEPTNNSVTLAPQSSTEVTFLVPLTPINSVPSLRMWLEGEERSNDLLFSSDDLNVPINKKSTSTTNSGNNILFTTIVTTLALIVLLAILIYMRKTKEPLEDINPTEEGKVN